MAIRNVRNFWINLDVDGRQPIATGPSEASGGASAVIKVRLAGDPIDALEVDMHANVDGTLTLTVRDLITNKIVSEQKFKR